MNYTYVSAPILRDLLSAKSKLTDLRAIVEANAALLKDIGLLDDIAAILYSTAYGKEEEHA